MKKAEKKLTKAERDKTVEAERATCLQIAHAVGGENVVYHVGELGRDCMAGKKLQIAAAKGHRSGAWRCYVTGLCALVQRRVGDHRFEYIAQRR